MGYRTLVMLYNDEIGHWRENKNLGEDINQAMNYVGSGFAQNSHFRGGQVVSCEHADTQVLALVDSYVYKPMAYSNWSSSIANDDVAIQLLKDAAAKLGYRLTKIRP